MGCRDGLDDGEGRSVHQTHHIAIDVAIAVGGELGVAYVISIGGVDAADDRRWHSRLRREPYGCRRADMGGHVPHSQDADRHHRGLHVGFLC